MSTAISPISGFTSTSSASSSNPAPTSSTQTGGLANESTFLTLLVSQMKNQDPLNPADSTQFVTQLAQFTQLEDMQNINQNIITMTKDLGSMAPPAPKTTPSATTGA